MRVLGWHLACAAAALGWWAAVGQLGWVLTGLDPLAALAGEGGAGAAVRTAAVLLLSVALFAAIARRAAAWWNAREGGRPLTPGEAREAAWMYGAGLDLTRVRIHRGKWAFWQPGGTAMAPDGHVYFPPKLYHDDFAASPHAMWLLIHELGHVWQLQSGVWLKLTRLWQGGRYDYGALVPGRPLTRYTIEQQASIIADWYRLRHRLAPHHGSGSAEAYETLIRAAIPA